MPGAGQGGTGSGAGAERAEKPVTLKELAKHLGLSPATVSVVINRAPAARSIPARTKERILRAARELNYTANFMARSLRSRRSFTVGVLLPELSEGYAAGVLSGVEDHLLQEGYFYLVASHRLKVDLLDEYERLLSERLVEGFILVNTPVRHRLSVPTVVVSGHRRVEGVTNVVVDHARAASLALAHLAELGHDRVAFFKGHPSSADTEVRWQAIVRAADRLGVQVLPELTIQLPGGSAGLPANAEEGYKEGYLFAQKLLARKVPFTSLFAFNDISAIGAMRALRDAGLRIPEDVSVVGFDDVQSAGFLTPSLTTVRQPLRQMGETAARILLERLGGAATTADEVTVEPELVVRESTAPPPLGRQRPLSSTQEIEPVL